MLFNSWAFLIFFLVVFLVQRILRGRPRLFFLLGASWFFYASWSPFCLPLLLLSIAVDWRAARGIHEARTSGRRRLWLGASLVVNLGLLAAFKYLPFLAETWASLTGAELMTAGARDWARRLLPLGISFYTLQTLSYTFDVYRRRIVPWPSVLDFALYVSFFPQLVAGPIVRAGDFLPQCPAGRRPASSTVIWGASLVVIGLFAKVVVGDRLCAPLSQRLFDTLRPPGFLDAWAGTFAFSVQVFHDFLGYSTVAVGLGLMMGFRLPWNFDWPFGATGFAEFWRRWHVTLHDWLRDYVYLPLRRRTGVGAAILLTFLLSGLWHGAAWTFVLFGLCQGLLVAGEGLLARRGTAPAGSLFRASSPSARGRDAPTAGTTPARSLVGASIPWLRRAAVFSVAFGLLMPLFRSPSMERCLVVWKAMVHPGRNACRLFGRGPVAFALLLAGACVVLHARCGGRSLDELFEGLPAALRPVLIGVMLVLVGACLSLGEEPFVYFQF